MLGALIIVFREAIEAGLIVGIVAAVTRGVAGSRLYITGGVAAGALGATVVAAFAEQLSKAFEGSGQEYFNAGVLALAVAMLAWHNIWMAKHGRELAQELSAVGKAVASGDRTLFALAAVVGLAVLREGAEVALFLYGVLASGESGASVLIGGAGGLALGALTSVATFYGLVSIPPKKLFAVTTGLITLLAAGLAAQAVAFLQQAGAITSLTDTLWDTSWILSDKSIPGRVLHTLIGYADQPSQMQVVVYAVTIAAIMATTKLATMGGRPQVRAPAE
ncbi:FTR1 family iron permease [Methylocystis parvus]|uniref:Iron permease n=1 Tax=Methylocystis parvus TaxID=134 RepID=A0A6B8M0T1_9HYPH|nr:FTR1 family protein [Methylocystis parvus]QGM97384.1 iron permease [Methylocystis parvus]WBJ98703.1 FTR1 family protein [Methylocystis parvus OBBP]